MYINWILKSQKPRNSNLVRKNRKNSYFSSRTKLEVLRYIITRVNGVNLSCLSILNVPASTSIFLAFCFYAFLTVSFLAVL